MKKSSYRRLRSFSATTVGHFEESYFEQKKKRFTENQQKNLPDKTENWLFSLFRIMTSVQLNNRKNH